ncbi:MAG: hypothetical protein QNK37_29050 [Acidobacteriota bacterium]|nr:hypothetical protein [Acidobacteriota bacterium]
MPAVADQLADARQDFKSALRVYYGARADPAEIVERHAEATATLRACVRHLWKDLRFQYRMGRIGFETLVLVQLPLKGTVPGGVQSNHNATRFIELVSQSPPPEG